jgi:hypothetical protein
MAVFARLSLTLVYVQYSSTRRLPSRLFTSTRRLFGSTTPSPVPNHPSMSSSSVSTRSGAHNGIPITTAGTSVGSSPPSQQRRLAEFATILGDVKLAAGVWEASRKEGKGGSVGTFSDSILHVKLNRLSVSMQEVLPILLAPSISTPLLVSGSLSSLYPSASDPPAYAQLRAMLYAIRWEIGISPQDFLGDILEGEQWLVWAAGNVHLTSASLLYLNAKRGIALIKAEEAPSALLLAHAALIYTYKQARRKAALWYFFAAKRLEKCGIVSSYCFIHVPASDESKKPLTMYFLRRAHELHKKMPVKNLSPSFWDSEGLAEADLEGLDAILAGIEHPLGRETCLISNIFSFDLWQVDCCILLGMWLALSGCSLVCFGDRLCYYRLLSPR